MRKRLLLSLGLLAFVLAGGVAVLWLTGPKHRIHREGWAEIRKGMTEPEVQKVLGAPPGEYGSDIDVPGGMASDWWGEGSDEIVCWITDSASISVYFSFEGEATGASLFFKTSGVLRGQTPPLAGPALVVVEGGSSRK